MVLCQIDSKIVYKYFKINDKYTNPAIGILYFCKQKLTTTEATEAHFFLHRNPVRRTVFELVSTEARKQRQTDNVQFLVWPLHRTFARQ